jgi:Ribonuclease G/E
MTKELFVTSTPHETKVGLVEDDQLAEIYLERENEYTLAGSIYKGRVTRVLPGMQSAFVDIGLERDAFLYVSDFMDLEDQDEDLNEVVPTNRPPLQESRSQESRPQPQRSEAPAPAATENASYVIESEPFEEESSTARLLHPRPAATRRRPARLNPVTAEVFAAAVVVVAPASRMIATIVTGPRIASTAPRPPSPNPRLPRFKASSARALPNTARLPAINR